MFVAWAILWIAWPNSDELPFATVRKLHIQLPFKKARVGAVANRYKNSLTRNIGDFFSLHILLEWKYYLLITLFLYPAKV